MEAISLKAIFGILSSLFIFAGGIPYINDIIKKRIKPHILSWLGWGFLTGIGGFAMLAEGSTWAVALLFANTVMCTAIAVSGAITKEGVWSTGIKDYIFFGAGLFGILLWQVLNIPVLALVCAISADLAFGIPTIIKTFKDSSTETPIPWILGWIGEVFGLLALSKLAFHEVAYPLYLFFFDTVIILIILKIIKKEGIRKYN
jgi:hypothetical protein